MSRGLHDRALGAYLGLALGDALGATVEFMTPAEIREDYGIHQHLLGGGWLRLRPGQVTDDTEMCLTLGRSILAGDNWSLTRFAEAMVRWLRGHPVDIGNTCRRGIQRYMLSGSTSSKPAEGDAGNGACVRNLPVVLATLNNPAAFRQISIEQAHFTHHHRLSDIATLALGEMLRGALRGGGVASIRRLADVLLTRFPEFDFSTLPAAPTPYIVDTVRTVLYGVLHTDSYKDCLITVVNAGGDADTTGALAGMLAGALYGMASLPAVWLYRLDPAIKNEILLQVDSLLARSEQGSLVFSIDRRLAVVFYEKPGCANNQRQKQLLRAAGYELDVHDLLQTPWTAETLRPYFTGRPVVEWFNPAAPRVKSREIVPESCSETEALAAMLQDPLLIRRPLLDLAGIKMAGFTEEQIRLWTSLAPSGYSTNIESGLDECRKSMPCPELPERSVVRLPFSPASSRAAASGAL